MVSDMSDVNDLGPQYSGLGNIRNLDHTMLLCSDMAAMRRFYVEVMGFDVHEEIPDRWLALRIGSGLLAFRRRGRPYDGPAAEVPTAFVQLAFRVPPGDVALAAAQLHEHGITPLEPMKDESFGHRTLFFADPEHNIIEVFAEI